MAGSVNKAIIVGRLTRDPETRSLQSGDRVCNITLATSERWTDKTSGEKQERSEFHRVVIFNQPLAKIAEQYIRKGSKVYIEGQLETRKWTDQNGQEKYSTEIVLRPFRGELTILDSKPDRADDRPAAASPSGTYAPLDKSPAPVDLLSDDVPF